MGTEVETSQGLLACSHKKLQGTYSLLELLKEGVWPSQHLDFDPEVLIFGGFPGGSVVRNLPANAGSQVRSLGGEDPLKKEMVTHSSILVWKIPMDRATWWATVHRVVKSRT